MELTSKQVRMAEIEESTERLDEFLDRLHGPDRGPQLPDHYGNGKPEENEDVP